MNTLEALKKMVEVFDSEAAHRYFTTRDAGGWTAKEIEAIAEARQAIDDAEGVPPEVPQQAVKHLLYNDPMGRVTAYVIGDRRWARTFTAYRSLVNTLRETFPNANSDGIEIIDVVDIDESNRRIAVRWTLLGCSSDVVPPGWTATKKMPIVNRL